MKDGGAPGSLAARARDEEGGGTADGMRGASGGAAEPGDGPGGVWTLLGAWIVVNGLLLGPWWFAAGQPGRAWIALEAGVLLGGAVLLPPSRWSRWLCRAGAVAAGAASLLLLADAATRQSLGRPLNLYLDLQLAPSVLHLLQGSLGTVPGSAAVAGGVVVWGALVLLAVYLVGRLPGLAPWWTAPTQAPHSESAGRRPRPGAAEGRAHRVLRWSVAGVGGILLCGSAASLAGASVPFLGLGRGWTERPAVVVVRQQLRTTARMLEARARFGDELGRGAASYAAVPGLLGGLGGQDVVLAFLESYGTTVLDDPRYAPVVRPRLEEMEGRLERAGLHVATARMLSPSQGGQSWLAHASILSGLWIEDQLRYDLLLASDRETLVDDFRHAGYETVAVMPAITMAWPEGTRFGYDRIWARRDIDYAGPSLNWVTMPDQFTWSFFQGTVRPGIDRPLFAELGLISSHAPWTPILPVLDAWEAIGDGAVFRRWTDAGEAPEELWRDPERVRSHFARSVEYAVHAALAWAERYLPDGGLLLLMGDHQPAPLITGDDAPRTVPVHVVSADRSLVEPFLAWGFAAGALPPEDASPHRMDAFRSWFVQRFSGTPGAAAGSEGR